MEVSLLAPDYGTMIGDIFEVSEYARESLFNSFYGRHSLLLVCPQCACTWAELRITPHQLFSTIAVSCVDCNIPTEYNPVPGTLLHNPDLHTYNQFDEDLLAVLPPSLLEREFWLHLKAYS